MATACMNPFELAELWSKENNEAREFLAWVSDYERGVFTDGYNGTWELRVDDAAHRWAELTIEHTHFDRYDTALYNSREAMAASWLDALLLEANRKEG